MKVFIENEAGSSQKNIYNEKTLEYKKTVEVSREYPYPYGFILGTTGGDGDNIDCFIITNRNLKRWEIIECEPIWLMEQKEISGYDVEEDSNVLAIFSDENFEINDNIKEKLLDFISHVFDHLPAKKLKVWNFLDQNKAIQYIENRRDK